MPHVTYSPDGRLIMFTALPGYLWGRDRTGTTWLARTQLGAPDSAAAVAMHADGTLFLSSTSGKLNAIALAPLALLRLGYERITSHNRRLPEPDLALLTEQPGLRSGRFRRPKT